MPNDDWQKCASKASRECMHLAIRASSFVIVRWARRLKVALSNQGVGISMNAWLRITAIWVLFASVGHADESVTFSRDVAPILIERCQACHGAKKAEGGYRVDSFSQATGEGGSGSPGFAAGELDGSEAFRRIMSEDEAERMPLDTEPLLAEQIDVLRKWIELGAEYDGDDPAAELITIVPPPEHPDPPAAYGLPVPVAAMTFSPDGSELIVGGYHELTVWNPADGSLVRRINNVSQRTYSLGFSPDGQLLVVGGGAPGRMGETRIFDVSTGEIVNVVGPTSDVVLDAAFNPAGDRLATAAADRVIRIFALPEGDLQRTITSHADWVTAIAWNSDGSQLASASRDKTAKVFDISNGDLLVTYRGHSSPIGGVAFHPDGKEVYSSGADNLIHRWQISDGAKQAEVAVGGEVFKLPLVGEFLFAPSSDKTVRQLAAGSHEQLNSFAGHQDWALSVAFHAGSMRLASGGLDGRVLVWNVEDGSPVTEFFAAPGYTAPQ